LASQKQKEDALRAEELSRLLRSNLEGLSMTKEFDYQWKNLPSPAAEYTADRVRELLDYVKLPSSFFLGKLCLDAGCGNGRWTYALQQLGGKVHSFDISPEAVDLCRRVNPEAYVFDLLNLAPNPSYDFVLCWGVLHHLPDPRSGFKKVASQIKSAGILHIMVYHRDTQRVYEEWRRQWKTFTHDQRLAYCNDMVKRHGGNLHGWWDAFNPEYNWSYQSKEVEKWFKEEAFDEITLTKKYNINMRGRRKSPL
jgi:2-polyprenyl-3-methyl-5-hydroxy-6-metoxy-1,4-benzoquinol methylase